MSVDEATRVIDEADPPDPGAPRGIWARLVTAALGLAVAGLGLFVVVRLLGWDGFTPLAQLMSFTPYLVPVAVLLVLVVAAMRRWRTGIAAGLVAGVLVALVAPRAIGGEAPLPAGGVPLRVMTANLWHGNATDELMALVRREQPDLLSIQECTQESLAALEAAGLRELLPYVAARPRPGVAGTALYGRAAFIGLRTSDPESRFDMARARTVHRGVTLDVVAAHPTPPVPYGDAVTDWRTELSRLPRPDRDDAVVSLLAGDLNATLDHAPLRRLLATGYTDAADAIGEGLAVTWQAGWVPAVTIDHILVEDGTGVRAVRVHRVGGSDHRAVVADLTLPSAAP
ncbi:MAG: endonuclease/exonuclease/phosphatase family protein [Micromonosporaceae bacterium]